MRKFEVLLQKCTIGAVRICIYVPSCWKKQGYHDDDYGYSAYVAPTKYQDRLRKESILLPYALKLSTVSTS
jgi:hypothetical protein